MLNYSATATGGAIALVSTSAAPVGVVTGAYAIYIDIEVNRTQRVIDQSSSSSMQAWCA